MEALKENIKIIHLKTQCKKKISMRKKNHRNNMRYLHIRNEVQGIKGTTENKITFKKQRKAYMLYTVFHKNLVLRETEAQ